ncbi:hypothetical protein E2C01_086280 [Portunus trituberculatus]|uniref:Uncharacterized protein n=1 Tax=Portunus trituberculatus TaxID=210409 RepID=A0A5B7JB35_PORTR|nr:hypothetical protein [Portunus trituberculatus]
MGNNNAVTRSRSHERNYNRVGLLAVKYCRRVSIKRTKQRTAGIDPAHNAQSCQDCVP